MPDLSLSVGPLTITPFFWGLVIAAVASSFSIWRKLKEDYSEDEIFSLTLGVLAAAVVFSRLLFILFHLQEFGLSIITWLSLDLSPNFFLPGAFLGAILAIVGWMIKNKKETWDVLDSLARPFLFFLLLSGIGLFLQSNNFWDLIYPGIGLSGLILFPWLKSKYRSFTWYKSGKTGFLIAVFSFYIFLPLLVLAFFKNDSLYLSRLFWLLLALAAVGALYYRAERDLKADFQGLFKRRKQ